MLKYGDKRDYKKIDIFLKYSDGTFNYVESTTWSKTCKDAKARWLEKNSHRCIIASDVKALFAK